jgi:hypothetical protein
MKEIYQMEIWWREGELETKDIRYVYASSIAEVEDYAENKFMDHYWDDYNGNMKGEKDKHGWWTYDSYRVAYCASVSKAEPIEVYDTDGELSYAVLTKAITSPWSTRKEQHHD